MNSFFDKILDTVAPRKGEDSKQDRRLATPEELRAVWDEARARQKVRQDKEIADLKQQADYMEEKAKQEKRIQAVTPARSPMFGGGGPAGSVLSAVWKRIPMKPVVVPLGLVIFILVCFKAC